MTIPKPVHEAEDLFEQLCEAEEPHASICDKSGGDLEYLEVVVEFIKCEGHLTLYCTDGVYSLEASDVEDNFREYVLEPDWSNAEALVHEAYTFACGR